MGKYEVVMTNANVAKIRENVVKVNAAIKRKFVSMNKALRHQVGSSGKKTAKYVNVSKVLFFVCVIIEILFDQLVFALCFLEWVC